jgi:exosortase B
MRLQPVHVIASLSPWLLVGLALIAMYAPTFYDLGRELWTKDEHAHGPIILVIVFWLAWGKRDALCSPWMTDKPFPGFLLLVAGVVLYTLGRSQEILIFEVGSLIPVLGGVLLATKGWSGVRAFWFALIFLVFLVPLPGIIVDGLTSPLKTMVSAIVTTILYAAEYPIARAGVVLTIGQYQVLVADACSGLNSLISLSALGVLYVYLMGRRSWLHNSVVLVSMLPIAFGANVIRVLVLVLVTYHFGAEAGEGIAHATAGTVLFLAALLLLLLLDGLLCGTRKMLRARST